MPEVLAEHVAGDQEPCGGQGGHQQRHIQAADAQGDREQGGRVEQPGPVAGDPAARALPQLVVDDQPRHHGPDREHGRHRQPQRAKGVRQLPEVGGHHGEGAGRQGGRQGAGQAGDQPPGAVGADHAGQQPRLTADPREDETHIDVGIGCDHPPDGGHEPGASGRRTLVTGLWKREAFPVQLLNQADDHLPDTLV